LFLTLSKFLLFDWTIISEIIDWTIVQAQVLHGRAIAEFAGHGLRF
jgi:hypothetical protein